MSYEKEIRERMNKEEHEGCIKDEAGIIVAMDYASIEEKVLANLSKKDKCKMQNDGAKAPKLLAGEILNNGASAIGNRASQRDTDHERSMAKTIKAFNVMYDTSMTEVMGWQFMVMLKMCRASQGQFRMDDYEDQASYSALAGEAAQE